LQGFYGKFTWQDGKLQIQEEYTSNQWNETDSARWRLEHFIYYNGERVPAYTIPNLPLPEKMAATVWLDSPATVYWNRSLTTSSLLPASYL